VYVEVHDGLARSLANVDAHVEPIRVALLVESELDLGHELEQSLLLL